MFIRDMVVLGIWENIFGFDEIDVASDINTIKVVEENEEFSSLL